MDRYSRVVCGRIPLIGYSVEDFDLTNGWAELGLAGLIWVWVEYGLIICGLNMG